MKIAVMAGFFAKRNMYINTAHDALTFVILLIKNGKNNSILFFGISCLVQLAGKSAAKL
jgi:hypothetical protein